MGAHIVTKQEFENIKAKLEKYKGPGPGTERIAKLVRRSAETVRTIGKHNNFTSYVNRKLAKTLSSFTINTKMPTAEQTLDRAESLAFYHSNLKRRVDAQGWWLTILWIVTIAALLIRAL